jgi:hypothetical protein
MFCIGAFSSLTSCFDRLTEFLPTLRSYHIPARNISQPCAFQLGPLNVCTMLAMLVSLILVLVWYVFRHNEWAWILQDILGAALCMTITSFYRIGNMRMITLILIGFFLYDIFFVFITPLIPIFQASIPFNRPRNLTDNTTTMRPTGDSLSILSANSNHRTSKKTSVMEQVALGLGTNGEIVPLLFALPMFISESEMDPCLAVRKSMLGFGDVILPVDRMFLV